MRRLFVVFLLAMLPLQFSWAAVASYCEHEARGTGHFGHHEHRHHAGASDEATTVADTAVADEEGHKAPGAMDLDCGHCHGQCSALPTPMAKLPVSISTSPPRVSIHEAGDAYTPTRPERPQWLPLA